MSQFTKVKWKALHERLLRVGAIIVVACILLAAPSKWLLSQPNCLRTLPKPAAGTLQLKLGGRGLTAVQQTVESTTDIYDCLREANVTAETPFSTKEFLAQTPTRLKLESAHFSPFQSDTQITLVVTYDVSRLYMLDGLCESWGGPISAAVYQPTFTQPENPFDNEDLVKGATLQVADLFERVRQAGTCALDIMVFSELLPKDDATMKVLFPVNSLRNRALLMARTELVLILDGDLLVQQEMLAKFRHGTARYEAIVEESRRRVFHVLPSFDTRQLGFAYEVAAGGKATCVQLFDEGNIVRFGAKGSRFPQGCTDYDRWKGATEQYAVTYCNRYEPWGIVNRFHTPWFDVRFRGYGRNKIMYAAGLNSTGFQFVIDPDSFIIHRPHPRSQAQRLFDNLVDKKVHNHIMAMYEHERARGFPNPVLDEVVIGCRQRLAWWTETSSKTR